MERLISIKRFLLNKEKNRTFILPLLYISSATAGMDNAWKSANLKNATINDEFNGDRVDYFTYNDEVPIAPTGGSAGSLLQGNRRPDPSAHPLSPSRQRNECLRARGAHG